MNAPNPVLLFAGRRYYPHGGVDDLVGTFDALDAAVAALRPDLQDADEIDLATWANAIDVSTGIVKRWERDPTVADPMPAWREVVEA